VSLINKLLPMATNPSTIDLAANILPTTVQDSQEARPNSGVGQRIRNLLSQYLLPSPGSQNAAPRAIVPDSVFYSPLGYGDD
jgi:hypothetical protein